MIYYIYRKQGYKSLLPLNKKYIFENVLLVVVKMKSGTMKVVKMKFSIYLKWKSPELDCMESEKDTRKRNVLKRGNMILKL